MTVWAIVVAAGRGSRFGDDGLPKAFRPVAGVPMYLHSIRAFGSVELIDGIALVCPANLLELAMEQALGESRKAVVEITTGGETRRASVRAGLASVPDHCERIVVHDAARPLVTPALIERALIALSGADGAVCAVPASDTLKRVRDREITETVARANLWRAQTPQAFRASILRAAHDSLEGGTVEATDDAVLVERAGGRVVVVDGDERNLKITTPADLEVAEMLLRGEHP
jgi:2-C-methyl-D-erythritol 4-phosphate cytidylyltransferase/2-C-methyl-D-erythritol 2,4-cyclodiphosphate synthase